MTTEEIKKQVPMETVLNRYGIKQRRGMCRCPFHGKDNHPSMKVYKDGVHCFTCGFNSDQIGFVQEYEHCDFKTAFLSLGGDYAGNAISPQRRALEERKREIDKREREQKKENERLLYEELIFLLQLCDKKDELFAPYSEEWCLLADEAEFLEFALNEKYIKGKEVNMPDVYRKCKAIRQKLLTVN